MRDQVDSFSNAPGNEDYFLNMFCVDKFFGGLSCCFVGAGGFLRQGMNAAVYICIVALIVINQGY